VIIDTAGRLHINQELMEELLRLKKQVNPHEILLVVDAMTGQDAVNVAKTFDERLGLDGVILTKLDGDTRGGAALSVKAVTGKPIKFVGTGEKLSDLEPFYPDRMASRILGMGDILTLIEKAQASIDEKKAQDLEKKLRQQQFTLEDFLDQLQQLKNMGSLTDIIGMLPGVDMHKLSAAGGLNEKELVKAEAIIQSMTHEERRNPSIVNSSRKKRIAAGSGTTIQDVNRLLKSFDQFKKMMKQMPNIERSIKRGRLRFPFM
jgi:signal recognition particle subunit SRP54